MPKYYEEPDQLANNVNYVQNIMEKEIIHRTRPEFQSPFMRLSSKASQPTERFISEISHQIWYVISDGSICLEIEQSIWGQIGDREEQSEE